MPVVVAEPLSMLDEQREVLERMARSSSLSHRMVVQAQALLMAADGVATNEVARRCGTTADSVLSWRRRFVEQGVDGVGRIARGRGRKSWLPEGTVAAVVHDTLHSKPEDGSTHWTTRLMAARHGIGKDSVARIWRDHELKPWKVDTFKISNDPLFEEKLVDVVGLYLNPPERAVVFSFDEKTQCQALDRTQPSLPMTRGRGETMTHDYKRNGTTDLFAALNVGTGEVLTATRKSHKSTDVLAFFNWIDLHVPRDLEIHVVLDNLSAHKAPPVTEWLAHPKRARWHLHLRDFFLRLHEAELVTIIWSDYAVEETRRALIRNGKPADKVDHLITILTSTTVESITPTNRPILGLPDPAGEPIAHAAIDGQVDYLITLNLKDFPTDKLDPARLEAISPDQAALIIMRQSPNDVRKVLRKQRAAVLKPPITPMAFMKRIRTNLPQLANLLTIEDLT
jgi:transposase